MSAYQNIVESMCKGLAPDPDLTVSEWADGYRILTAKGAIEPGKYKTRRTPYLKEIMDCLSVKHECTDLTFVKATQLGATEAGNNFVGYIIDVAPGPCLMVLPTDDLAKDHSRSKLTPAIEETPSTKKKIYERQKGLRGKANTIQTKDFQGGILFLSGANSPANYRNKSIRYLILDDLDGFPYEVGKEGNPGKLAENRTDTFSRRKKIYRNSTPTEAKLSPIWDKFQESDQRYYHVPCPFCGHKQALVWGGPGYKRGIKFRRNAAGEVQMVWYECESCHEPIDEQHKPFMLENGEWVPTYKTRKKRGYHLSSLYSPLGWVSWLQIVEEFLKAKDDPPSLKVWTNTRLALCWDEKGSQPKWSILKARAQAYSLGNVPQPVCVLTGGVDVQENRLVVLIRGWGQEERSWLIYFNEIYGDPEQADVWNQLDELLKIEWSDFQGNYPLKIYQIAVDSGYLSNSVYNYARMRETYVMATKGMGQIGRQFLTAPTTVDVDFNGEKIRNGCKLWPLGVDQGKRTVYHRLNMETDGKGFYNFPSDVSDEYYLQLTAEKKVTQYHNGYAKPLWKKLRERNEALDCEVMALAALYKMGGPLLNWDKLLQAKLSGTIGVKKKRERKQRRKQKRRSGNW